MYHLFFKNANFLCNQDKDLKPRKFTVFGNGSVLEFTGKLCPKFTRDYFKSSIVCKFAALSVVYFYYTLEKKILSKLQHVDDVSMFRKFCTPS